MVEEDTHYEIELDRDYLSTRDIYEHMIENPYGETKIDIHSDWTSSDEEWLHSKSKLRDYTLANPVTHYQYGDQNSNSEYENSEGSEYETLYESNSDPDDIPKQQNLPKVDDNTEFRSLVWRVGMKFNSPELFREMVNRYAVIVGYNIQWTRNLKMKKLGARCKAGCSWSIYASWNGDKSSFVVKSVNPNHSCNRQDFENIQCRPKWLAREFMMQYKIDPNWSKKALTKVVMEKFGVKLESWACYRVKKEAHKLLHGSLERHYMKIGSYLKELTKNDPETMVEVMAIEPEFEGQPKVFQRLYVSLSGLRKGFLQGCRPVLCVDGCFLKTFLGGQLLVAVGRDGNNQMFPMCWAVVEGENNDSWHWFLSNIKKDLEGFQVEGATIISDQHQSIVAAIASLFPNVEHRLCSRHIFAKWKKAHKGDAYKDAFYKVVKAHNMASYELALEELKVLSTKATSDFVKEGPKRFCRAFMRTTSKCDLVVNNLAETFNGYIIESRSKPIVDMLEEIRLQLMGRLFNKKRWMMKQDDNICPRIRKKLEKNKEYARKCTVVASTDRLFQVYDNTDMLVVNL